MAIPKVQPFKPPNLYGVLEGAALLIEKSNRIKDTVAEARASSITVATIPIKELEALAKLSELSALMIDQLVYMVELNQVQISKLREKEKKKP